MMTGSLKKKDLKKKKFNFKKRGGSLIRACSLIRSNTVLNNISKIQGGHSVIVASSFGQTRPSVLKPDNSHFSDGPLIILSLQLLLMSIKNNVLIICNLYLLYNNVWHNINYNVTLITNFDSGV